MLPAKIFEREILAPDMDKIKDPNAFGSSAVLEEKAQKWNPSRQNFSLRLAWVNHLFNLCIWASYIRARFVVEWAGRWQLTLFPCQHYSNAWTSSSIRIWFISLLLWTAKNLFWKRCTRGRPSIRCSVAKLRNSLYWFDLPVPFLFSLQATAQYKKTSTSKDKATHHNYFVLCRAVWDRTVNGDFCSFFGPCDPRSRGPCAMTRAGKLLNLNTFISPCC